MYACFKYDAVIESTMAIAKDTVVKLSAEEIPKKWYNLAADLKNVQPMINPATKEPVKAEEMEAIFCKTIIKQEMTKERYVDIPEEVRDNLVALNRPSNLQRAIHLEKYLKTPAKIYFKREDMSPLCFQEPGVSFFVFEPITSL